MMWNVSEMSAVDNFEIYVALLLSMANYSSGWVFIKIINKGVGIIVFVFFLMRMQAFFHVTVPVFMGCVVLCEELMSNK